MRFPRSSGILLHPTSLPGQAGVGDLGPNAFAFADFLAGAGQAIWQLLPLSPTGYGDSPYQSFSAFAGNPLLISLDMLHREGLLDRDDVAADFPPALVDFARVIPWKQSRLMRAAERFLGTTNRSRRDAFDQFCRNNDEWLSDFALFMVAKAAHGGRVWTEWDRGLRARKLDAMKSCRTRLATQIEVQKLWQFWFREQWTGLRKFCHDRRIRLFGDVPIYVAHDSADVWANQELFALDSQGRPERVAGVPPDYFSATGQLWGNPIYRWDRMRQDGYGWWVRRFRSSLESFDMVRLDHFRGFQAYWEIPAGEHTAQNGRWIEGPGADFFAALTKQLGELPIVAENLGVITPEVEAMRAQFGFPGMAILQFAFGKDPQGPSFRPHNYLREIVAYSGTHDNDTVVGWWNSVAGASSVRTAADIEKERWFARVYLGLDSSRIHSAFIRALMASVADTVVVPMQDVLGLGSEARMNLPGRPSGNWRWRMTRDALTDELQAWLGELVKAYDR